ncbi:9037_t:CDS:2, partial [Entrophospora sp. SA101]
MSIINLSAVIITIPLERIKTGLNREVIIHETDIESALDLSSSMQVEIHYGPFAINWWTRPTQKNKALPSGFSCELDGGSIVCEATSATINHMYKNFTNKKGTEYSGNVILGFDNLEVTNELLKDCTNWDGVGEGFCSSFASRFKLMSCHFVQKFWIHFNKLGQVSGFQQPCAQCKYCNYEINTVIGKCVAHFKICSRVSITILQGYFGPNFQPNSNQHNNSCLPIEQNTVITTKHLQNSSINNFVDRISLVEQAKAELLFAQTIYQCKLFLSLPELEPIKALFKKLHPLDNIINSADYICLVSDGCNQLAIELTITLLSRNQAVNIDEDIKNIVQDNGFWEEVEELDKNLLDGDIEFIENENEESEYSNSSSSENEKRNQESDDLYDSD